MPKAKKEKGPPFTVLIMENRHMIGAILADLLGASGYQTYLATDLAEAQETLPQHLPAFLLADVGMIRADQQEQWQSLEETAKGLGVLTLCFSCSPLPDVEDLLVLRSPGDFANIIRCVEQELRRRQPYLGMTLVSMGRLKQDELEAALRIQGEMARIGRQYALGDLLVRLGLASPEDVEQALREQER